MEKLKFKLTTPNFTNENAAKLAELFPHCVTEKKNSKGALEYAIDFDLLRQEFSDNLVEGPQERYQLNWPGKREALVAANTPISKTLRPCREESVNFDTTQNIFIEGDNLDALKLLQETYLNKIKMIYIDPPYNTGKDFVYSDNFTADKGEYDEASGQRDEEGGRLVANPDSNGRFHSDWLSMMYPRLKLARNLLRDDGVIFISIDDNEQANLKRLCDEVFGEDNFICSIMWKRKKEISSDSKNVAIQGEFILAYSKSNAVALNFESLSTDYIAKSYKKPTVKFPLGKWRPVPLTVSKGLSGGGYNYDIKTPTGKIHSRLWAYPEASFKKLLDKKLIYFGVDDNGTPQRVIYAHESKGQPTTNYWENTATNKEGKKAVLELFDDNLFDTPKPTSLIKRLSNLVINNGHELILDFFAGSGTTAHAVMQLNAEDAGNRKCISVQLAEKTNEKSEAYKAGYKNIAEIAKERIRRAGKKIKADNEGKEGIETLDIGFRVFKIDSSNMEDVSLSPDETHPDMFDEPINHIKADRSSEDLLFQVLLDWGVDLTLPIAREEIEGKEVFFVDENALAACFDHAINETFVKKLAEKKPLRVVFRDDGFTSDAVKINVEQIFKLKSPTTDIKVI